MTLPQNSIIVRAYFEFMRTLREEVTTFADFERIARSTINHKEVGMTDEEFTKSITHFGGDLE